tara:strand:+ start:388 stop:543 length:156 start_codon:yes stop_codon:yes gene_type:complete
VIVAAQLNLSREMASLRGGGGCVAYGHTTLARAVLDSTSSPAAEEFDETLI